MHSRTNPSNTLNDHAIKKILIVGAGAVGGYFGAVLKQAGLDVTFLLREKTYEKVSTDGLEIRSPAGDFTVQPKVIQSASECTSADLIILTVKCYDLSEALKPLRPLINKGSLLLTLQNGITAEEEILRTYPKASLLAGVAIITAKRLSPGIINHSQNGSILLGELSGEKSSRAKTLQELLSHAGISCFLKSRMRQAKWEKLCWNATFNPLSVILNHPVSLILDSEHLLRIVRSGIQEIIHVAEAEGISLHPEIIEKMISVTGPLRHDYTSMYEDYRNGSATEIEALNGEVIRRGKKHGIATPTHAMLYRLIKGLELKRRTK